MVTAVQVKGYLQPLLAKHDDLALVGRLLVVKPVHHILRGVLIDRRSWAEAIVPVWFMYHMFGPYPTYYLSWGDRLWGCVWRTTDTDVGTSLCAEIERLALPKLRPIQTLQDFVEAVPSTRGAHHWSKNPWGKSLIDIAMGDLQSASLQCRARICDEPVPGPKEPDSWKAEYAGGKKLCDLLLRDDHAGLVRQLHEWEAANVKALKIDHLWEPSPFPIELM